METRIDPALYHEFYGKLALSMRLPVSTRKILRAFVNVDVNAGALADVIGANPYLRGAMAKLVQSLGLKGDPPGPAAAVVLVGMQGTRDFFCALQLAQVATGRRPGVSKEGKYEFAAGELLKYARKAEEYAVEHKIPYQDCAFAAGLMFDLLIQAGKRHFGAPKGFDEYAAQVFSHGLKAARVATELTRNVRAGAGVRGGHTPAFSKYLFAAVLVHDIGKLAMELLHPPGRPSSYQDFLKRIAGAPDAPPPRAAIHLLETKIFGLTHDHYGAQLCYHFHPLRDVARAVLFHHDPYLARSAGLDTLGMARLIALSSNVANHFRPPGDGAKDPTAYWYTPELEDFSVNRALVAATVKNLGAEAF